MLHWENELWNPVTLYYSISELHVRFAICNFVCEIELYMYDNWRAKFFFIVELTNEIHKSNFWYRLSSGRLLRIGLFRFHRHSRLKLKCFCRWPSYWLLKKIHFSHAIFVYNVIFVIGNVSEMISNSERLGTQNRILLLVHAPRESDQKLVF